MKNVFLVISVFALLISCTANKDTTTGNQMDEQAKLLIGHTWKLVGMTFYEKDQYIIRPEDEKGLTLTFQEDGKIAYQLSVNNCFGNYTLESDKMTVTLGGCTKMCCDSEFADDFQNVLSTAKSYKISGEDYLSINGEEKILKLERVKE